MNESKVIHFLLEPCALFGIIYFLLWPYPIDFTKIFLLKFHFF